MTDPKFKQGEIVFLNSGSPPLTVSQLRDDGLVDVEWFTGEETRRDAFPSACLRYAGEPLALRPRPLRRFDTTDF